MLAMRGERYRSLHAGATTVHQTLQVLAALLQLPGGALFLSKIVRRHMLSVIVKRPIPKGLCRIPALLTLWGIRYVASFTLPALAFDSATATAQQSFPLATQVKSVVSQYCVSCHDADVKKGGLNLEGIVGDDVAQHAKEWEHVVRKLRARQMPPI